MKIRILKEREQADAMLFVRTVQKQQEYLEEEQRLQANEEFLAYTEGTNIQEMCKRGDLILWGAFMQGQLVGVSGMQKEGHITLLYVHPQMQHQKVGAQLLQKMMNYATGVCGLSTVTVNVMPSIQANFFEKQGFQRLFVPEEVSLAYVPMFAPVPEILEYSFRPMPVRIGVGMSVLCMFLILLSSILYIVFEG